MNYKLIIIAIFNFTLIIPITYYFKFFPTIISNTLTNLMILVLLSTYIITLIISVIIMEKNNRDYLLILSQSLIFIFILNLIPILRLSNPIIHDPYFYFVTTQNIIDYATLNPILINYYPTIEQQLHWPILELLTTNLTLVSGIDPFQFMRFLQPFIGTIIFLSTFILCKTVSNDNKISILAALIASLCALSLFLNSEFHPQSIAPLFFILLIYFYYKFKYSKIIRFGVLMLILILIFAMTHHFSSLFIGLFAIIYIVTVYILTKIKFLDSKFINLVNEIQNYNFWILIAVAMLSYHIYAYFQFIVGVSTPATSYNPQFSLISIGVPLYVTITNSSKWIVFFLALPAIYYSYKNRSQRVFQFSLIFLCFVIAGILGSTIMAIPTDRIIIFYYPFASLLAAITIFKMYDGVKSKKNIIRISLIGLIAITFICGVFSSQTPAYYFKNSEIDTFYWSSNDLSSAKSFENAGTWIYKYTNSSRLYATEFDTRSLTFYFGKIGKIYYYQSGIPLKFKGYVVVNPSIPYEYKDFNKINYLSNINTFYSDGEIIVGGNIK